VSLDSADLDCEVTCTTTGLDGEIARAEHSLSQAIEKRKFCYSKFSTFRGTRGSGIHCHPKQEEIVRAAKKKLCTLQHKRVALSICAYTFSRWKQIVTGGKEWSHRNVLTDSANVHIRMMAEASRRASASSLPRHSSSLVTVSSSLSILSPSQETVLAAEHKPLDPARFMIAYAPNQAGSTCQQRSISGTILNDHRGPRTAWRDATYNFPRCAVSLASLNTQQRSELCASMDSVLGAMKGEDCKSTPWLWSLDSGNRRSSPRAPVVQALRPSSYLAAKTPRGAHAKSVFVVPTRGMQKHALLIEQQEAFALLIEQQEAFAQQQEQQQKQIHKQWNMLQKCLDLSRCKDTSPQPQQEQARLLGGLEGERERGGAGEEHTDKAQDDAYVTLGGGGGARVCMGHGPFEWFDAEEAPSQYGSGEGGEGGAGRSSLLSMLVARHVKNLEKSTLVARHVKGLQKQKLHVKEEQHTSLGALRDASAAGYSSTQVSTQHPPPCPVTHETDTLSCDVTVATHGPSAPLSTRRDTHLSTDPSHRLIALVAVPEPEHSLSSLCFAFDTPRAALSTPITCRRQGLNAIHAYI
jgi:hypothetical protein